MVQEVRFRIYAAAAALFAFFKTVGWLTDAQADTLLLQVASFLEAAAEFGALAALILAAYKTMTSRTTTLDIPRDQVMSVTTASGRDVPVRRRDLRERGVI
jgi:hypothetical protein